MRIVWSVQARQDLLSLFNYLAKENPKAAVKLRSIILSKVELLALTPNIGRPGRVPGSRELVVEKTPYVIPYRCVQDRIEIIRVYHGSRKWPGSF